MPLWLRKFIYKKIKDHYDKKAEQVQNAKQPKNSTNLINSDGTSKTPTKSKYS
tara:strand:+ start:1563 stop:1721 length:159 start_codon:yes stop_codon:yes gene_type:complete